MAGFADADIRLDLLYYILLWYSGHRAAQRYGYIYLWLVFNLVATR